MNRAQFSSKPIGSLKFGAEVRRDSFLVETDPQNQERFILTFTFDAAVDGSITVIFFAKEGVNGNLTPMKEQIYPPVTVHFQPGLNQKYRHPSGIDISADTELMNTGQEQNVCPLVVKVSCTDHSESSSTGTNCCHITRAVFQNERNKYHVRILKEIVWAKGIRYALHGVIGGFGTVVDGERDCKNCVICMSKTSETIVLPCRHMCMCVGCGKDSMPRLCPVCRQPIKELIFISGMHG